MKRRGDGEGDSLELLLDTICNMFGTIMFVTLIAALLALVTRRGQTEESLAIIDAERQREVERLERVEGQLSSELERLPALVTDPDVEAAEDRLERALGEIARRQTLVNSYRAAVEIAREGVGNVGRNIGPLRAEVERIEESIETAARARHRKLRTPLERELMLETYVVVLWKDRLYPICDWSDHQVDPCERLVQWHARYTHKAKCKTSGYCGARGIRLSRSVPLREEAGIPVSTVAELARNAEFRALLRTLEPSQHLVMMSVASDSFDSFAVVKEAFLSAGFNYAVAIDLSQLPVYEDLWVEGIPVGL